MDSSCIKQTVCKVLKIFQYGKYLVAYVLNQIKLFLLYNLRLLWERENNKNLSFLSRDEGGGGDFSTFNGVARTLKKLRTSMGDYWIKQ